MQLDGRQVHLQDAHVLNDERIHTGVVKLPDQRSARLQLIVTQDGVDRGEHPAAKAVRVVGQTAQLTYAVVGRSPRAKRGSADVDRIGTNPGQYRWLLDQEGEQRQTKGLAGLPLSFFEPYIQSRQQPAQCVLSLRADLGRERVAAMMFLIHGQAATYQVGWSSPQGRDLNAHNLLLWQAMSELKARGVRRLDLGGINTTRSAGLARFKLGTGGQVQVLAGTYLA